MAFSKSKLSKLLGSFVFSVSIFVTIFYFALKVTSANPPLLIIIPFFVFYGLTSMILFLILVEIFKSVEIRKLSFRILLISVCICLSLLILFLETPWAILLIVFIPLLLISFISWILYTFFRDESSLLRKIIRFMFGLLTMVGILIVIVVSSALYIQKNPERFRFSDWSYNILSLPETIKLIYFQKTGQKDIDTDYLNNNSKINENSLYTDSSQTKITKKIEISVPKIQSGKIAFIKNNNLWVADGNGVATQLTNDNISINNSGLFPTSVDYQHPSWSTDGNKIVFIQAGYVSGISIYRLGYTDGKTIAVDYGLNNGNLPPYWLDDSHVLTASNTNFIIEKVTFDNGHFGTESNVPNFPFFGEYHVPDGCDGGGGQPDWYWKLEVNNQGYASTNRSSLFYLPEAKKVVYSTGCAQEVALTKDSTSRNSDWFDKNNKAYEIIKSLEFMWGSDIPFLFRVFPNDAEFHGGPNQLTISPDKNLIVGIQDGNVILYDFKQNFIRTLSDSGRAYNPVFSSDSKTVYYADNAGSQNINSIDLTNSGSKTIFKSSKVGAISNISVSPNNKQIIFTLITETAPLGSNPKDEYYSSSREDLYLVNSDGTDAKLFVSDASQSSWNPK